jgi:hypothetical protein
VDIVNNFNILFTNADTLTQTKLQELKLRIEDTPPSIIAISEVINICKIFKESTKLQFSQLILFGDLNFPNIDWTG